MASSEDQRKAMRATGAILLASGFLAVVLMAHHPTGASGTAMMRGVHGAIMAMMLVLAIGFVAFVRLRGTATALAGLVVYAASVVAGLAAGTINGFVVPELADRGVDGFGELLWAVNQAFASLGVVATGIAYAIWALDLWCARWRFTSATAAFAGMVPAGLLLFDRIGMDLHGAMFAYGLNAGWAVWLGAMLWREARHIAPQVDNP